MEEIILITIYGTPQCPDCVAAKDQFTEQGIEFEYKNIEELTYLKEFLKLRDTNPAFHVCKEKGSIGIPCMVKEDGSITLNPEDVLSTFKAGQACSLDGTGC